jgi:hypothetical protein
MTLTKPVLPLHRHHSIFCNYCSHDYFPTRAALERHIKVNSKCRHAYNQELTDRAVHRARVASQTRTDCDRIGGVVTDNMGANEESGMAEEFVSSVNGEGHVTQHLDAVAMDVDTENGEPSSKTSRIEDVADEDDIRRESKPVLWGPWAEFVCCFDDEMEERPAGFVVRNEWTEFECLQAAQRDSRTARWGTFKNQSDWELARWLVRNVRHKQMEEFMKLTMVSGSVAELRLCCKSSGS